MFGLREGWFAYSLFRRAYIRAVQKQVEDGRLESGAGPRHTINLTVLSRQCIISLGAITLCLGLFIYNVFFLYLTHLLLQFFIVFLGFLASQLSSEQNVNTRRVNLVLLSAKGVGGGGAAKIVFCLGNM